MTKLGRNLVFIKMCVIASVLFVACTKAEKKIVSAPSVVSPSTNLNIYTKEPIAGGHITIADLESQTVLKNEDITVPLLANPKVPNSVVTAGFSTKDSKGDAISLSWKDAWRAGINIESETTLDASRYVENGIVSFDINLTDIANAGLAFKIKCGADCERSVPYLLPGRELQGKGWQHLSFSMKCFAREGDDFSHLTQPFGVESSGAGELSIANVKYELNGIPNASCPDYKQVSVIPSMLNEAWSISWWLPRHQEKLAYIRENKVDLVFIGDSITNGWEKEGLNVWNKYYKNRKPLNIGFSGDRTENVLWRLQHGEVDGINPKVAVLLIGTNNTGHRYEDPKTTAIGIKRDIEEIQARLPKTKILLMAIFPRDENPNAAMRKINNSVNAIIAGYADNKNIYFLNIENQFLNKDGILSKDIMPDLLHPNEKGYEIWAKAMEPTLSKLLMAK